MVGGIPHPSRNEHIFRRGLPTETVSLYLLCCGLLDAGIQATRVTLGERWNAGADQLTESLDTLLADGILTVEEGTEGSEASFIATPPDHWRRMG